MPEQVTISKVEVFKAAIKLKKPFRISLVEMTCAENIFVRIHTNTGLYGMGEGSAISSITGDSLETMFAGARDLAMLIVNENPLDVDGRIREMKRFVVHNSALRSAFDVALYDILGKAVGLPLYALLGGNKRSFWTDNTVGIAAPDVMAQEAAKLKAEGFRAIKVKLGTTMKEDVRRIEEIRKAVGDSIPLRIDANQGWDYRTAVDILNAIEPLGIEYCEQPTAYWDHANMARIRLNTTIPIMADESLCDDHDAFKLASAECCDYFNIKLSKSGGIHTALKINAVAEAAGIACMLGCMNETRLALTAGAHFVSARPNVRYANLDTHFALAEDPIIGGAQWNVGEITLPDAPGHGADVDPTFLEVCESITVD
jgi:L-alanine-DL-glutamate epimerase-like enolase superfamily enzyme